MINDDDDDDDDDDDYDDPPVLVGQEEITRCRPIMTRPFSGCTFGHSNALPPPLTPKPVIVSPKNSLCIAADLHHDPHHPPPKKDSSKHNQQHEQQQQQHNDSCNDPVENNEISDHHANYDDSNPQTFHLTSDLTMTTTGTSSSAFDSSDHLVGRTTQI